MLLYHGYNITTFARFLYPGIPLFELTKVHETTTSDVLFVGKMNKRESLDSWKMFPGTVVELNGESEHTVCNRRKTHYKFISLGPSAPSCNVVHVFYLYAAFSMLAIPNYHAKTQERRASAVVPKKVLLYANSHCVKFRESMFNLFVQHFPKKSVESGGRCHGSYRATTNSIPGAWHEMDAHRFGIYKFVLAMENKKSPEYVTEKLANAFALGAVPIYWGNVDSASRLFNSNAFLRLDPDNPMATLMAVRYLNKNDTAYLELRNRPYLSQTSDSMIGVPFKTRILDLIHGRE